MEPHSAFLTTRCVPWQRLLLAASLLTFRYQTSTTAFTIEVTPPFVLEGSPALLSPKYLKNHVNAYEWYRGDSISERELIIKYTTNTEEHEAGPEHTDREYIFHNGSLRINNVNMIDEGFYTLLIRDENSGHERASVHLVVYSHISKPSITGNMTETAEGQNTVELRCEHSDRHVTYGWRLNNKNLPGSNRARLSQDNKTLTLPTVTRQFTGHYECEARNPATVNRSDPFTLNVLYGPDNPQISPKDTYFEEGTTLKLACVARSNPTAQYSWTVNGKPVNSPKELVIDQLMPKNTGLYTCTAFNLRTSLRNSTGKNVTIVESLPNPTLKVSRKFFKQHVDMTCASKSRIISIYWWFNSKELKLTERMTLTWDSKTLTISPIKSEDVGIYQCEISNSFLLKKSDPFNLEISNAQSRAKFPMEAAAITAICVQALAGLAVLGGLMYILIKRKTGRQEMDIQGEKVIKQQDEEPPSQSSLLRLILLEFLLPKDSHLLHPGYGNRPSRDSWVLAAFALMSHPARKESQPCQGTFSSPITHINEAVISRE